MRRWRALLAPLGIGDGGGRMLDRDAVWTLRAQAPLLLTNDGETWLRQAGELKLLEELAAAPAAVGLVTSVRVEGTHLYAFGTVSSAALAQHMAANGLRPQMELEPAQVNYRGSLDWPETVVAGGQVTAVALGTLPAFRRSRFEQVDVD